MRNFGEQLAKARKAKGYRSAQSFAFVMGIEPHTYRTYERGEAQPTYDNLSRMCSALGITVDDLLPTKASEARKVSEEVSDLPNLIEQ